MFTLEEFPFTCGGWSSFKASIEEYEKVWGFKYKLKIIMQIECIYPERRIAKHLKTYLKEARASKN